MFIFFSVLFCSVVIVQTAENKRKKRKKKKQIENFSVRFGCLLFVYKIYCYVNFAKQRITHVIFRYFIFFSNVT